MPALFYFLDYQLPPRKNLSDFKVHLLYKYIDFISIAAIIGVHGIGNNFYLNYSARYVTYSYR